MSKESKKLEGGLHDESIKDDTPSGNPTETVNRAEFEVDLCKKELEQWKTQCLRTSADLQNFKRRMEKEQAEWATRAQERVLFDLLNVVDDFDRAFKEVNDRESSQELKRWFEGFELIYKSLQKLLQQYEVREIDKVVEFDPHIHEAVAQIVSPHHQSGKIVDVLQKGYMFKDQVLRPAKVVVAQ